jgi:glucosamine kinase
LHAGVDEVCATAGLRAEQIERAVAGIAGSSNDEVHASLLAMLQQKVSGEIAIVGDMVVAHEAALEGSPGVLVNSGTGSIAYGRNAKNETARAGGWGFAISDEGSGHWIGHAAVAVAMRRFDAHKDDGFLHHLIAAVGTANATELAQFANSTANPDFAQACPAVLSLADHGDTTAQEILKRAGEELAELGHTVLAGLFGSSERVQVAATGGVFCSSTVVFQSFCMALLALHSGAAISLSRADPAMGALMLARHHR